MRGCRVIPLTMRGSRMKGLLTKVGVIDHEGI